MLRGLATMAVGVALGVVFRDGILGRRAGARPSRRPATGKPRGPDFRFSGVLRDTGAAGRFTSSDHSTRPPEVPKPPKSLTQCFDDMRSDYDAVGNAITDYSNAHPNDPDTTLAYLAWWTSIGEQMNQLIRDIVLNSPAVIASISIVRQNSNQLTAVRQEFKQATATLNQLNSGLSVLSALVSLFKQ